MSAASKSRIAICLLLAAMVSLAFSPTLRNGFTGYDDGEYVTDNHHVNTGLSWENTVWAFTSAHSSNWHPLTWLSHGLDCALFGLDPAGHHLTSLLLHIANTLLLFLWLDGATGRRGASAFVAAVFGLHPLHVESVAWVAERKDVLAAFFWMLTLMAYSAYARKPGRARYAAVAALFAAGLLAKPMLVTVPLQLLLLDWWPLGRRGWKRLVLEKVPLLFLSALSCAVAVWAQRQSGSIASNEQWPLGLRLSNAALAYARYLGKTVWPVKLAVFYPMPQSGVPVAAAVASVFALAGITYMAIAARQRHPWLMTGWLWYLLTLVPVIGIVQVGMQSMADRYMYVPMTGLLIAATWECADAWGRQPGARLLPVAAGLVLAACGFLTWRQTEVWRDGGTLFTHALEVTRDNFLAHDNLGVELERRGQMDEALVHYRETLRIKPGDRHGEYNYANACFTKGARLYSDGRLDGALGMFQEGLRIQPHNALARTYAGQILTGQHRLEEAIAELRRAIVIDPTLARAYMGLGVAYAWSGRAAEARRAFEETLRLDPSNVEAHYNLGLVQFALGRFGGALESYDAALKLKPDFGPALAARAEALYAMGRYQDSWSAVLAARAAGAQVDPGVASRLAARVRR